MYDIVLISTHYHYDKDGQPLPRPEDTHYQDLSMVIPLGLIHLAQALHDKGLTVQVVHLSLIHISEPTRRACRSRMPSSA